MMKKTMQLFDQRNEQKKSLEFGLSTKSADVGEFWRYQEGINLGNEISKDGGFKRVCLVLNNNMGNRLLRIMPITTKYHHRMSKYYIEVLHYERYSLKKCRLIINQVKLIDKKRLCSKLSPKTNQKLASYARSQFTTSFL